MFTNGDNMYSSHWFDALAHAVLHSTGSDSLVRSVSKHSAGITYVEQLPVVDVLAWDFVTHHKRRVPRSRGRAVRLHHQTIAVDVERRGMVDLGSVLVRRHLYQTPYRDTCFFDSTTPHSVGQSVADTQLCAYQRVQYLPDSFLTMDVFARDFFTIQTLLRNSRNHVHSFNFEVAADPKLGGPDTNGEAMPKVRILHETLMFHQ